MEQELKFSGAIAKLEKIIDKLEAGVDDLDEIVRLFEEGSSLVKYCGEKLANVEAKIEVISRKLTNDNPRVERQSLQMEIPTK